MLPFVTVFSNLASVNILDAAPQVVAALPGMTPEKLQAVLSQRGDPALDPRSLLGWPAVRGPRWPASRAYRVTVGVETRQRTTEHGGGRDPASRKRQRALSCIVVAQRFATVALAPQKASPG